MWSIIDDLGRRVGPPRRRAAALLVLLLLPCGAAAQSRARIVRGLSFEGNHAFDATVLSSVISTTNSSWFATQWYVSWLGFGTERTFSEQAFRTDRVRLEQWYKRNGYYDVKVDTVVKRTAEDVNITFKISEGEPLRLSVLHVNNIDSVPEPWRIRQDLPLRAGDVFSRYVLFETADTVLARLHNQGYATADLVSTFTVDSANHAATATLAVTLGPPAVWGPIRVTGLEKVDSQLIVSLLTARTGDPYREDDVYRSQRALYASELFSFATVQIDSANYHTPFTQVPLLVDVREARRHVASGAVGYGTDDCFRTAAGWSARNFFGQGRVLSLNARLSKIGAGEPLDFGAERSVCSSLRDDSIGSSKINYSLNASLRRNGFLSPDNLGTLSVFAERRSEFQVYLREDVGAAVSLTRETVSRIPLSLTYRFTYGRTEASDASFCAFFQACAAEDIAKLRPRRGQGTLTFSATRQRLNNPLDPTRGSSMAFEAAGSAKLLGSSQFEQFVRFSADIAGYLPLTRTVVLAGHLRGGIILAPQVDLSAGSVNFIPPDQRFYAGGPNDVRGYDRNQLGPLVYVVADTLVDTGGNVSTPEEVRVAATGGSRVAVGNAELRLPSPFLSTRLRFALFLDAGTLGREGAGTNIRFTPGAGIRFVSPVGPIRFDVAYNHYPLEAGPLYRANRDGSLTLVRQNFVKDRNRSYTFHFSVGQAF